MENGAFIYVFCMRYYQNQFITQGVKKLERYAWKATVKEGMLEEYCRRVLPDYPQIRLVDFSPIEISSTRLREMAAKGEDLSPWVPAGVAEYIYNHGLYQTKEAVEQ